ncbi:MAG: hypothetical protein GKR89_30320 [Candidatus Latescibacteria bacterium]|nr:hypothetical protein [Candidatus Latescibacterota bacterium]
MQLVRTSCCFFLGLVLLQCNGAVPGDTPEVLTRPAVDRELWAARLQLNEPSLKVDIQARYVREQGRYTHADSGVQVHFASAVGTTYSRLEALRLTLDPQKGHIATAGNIRVTTGEGVQLRADSLLWERRDDVLHIPGAVYITAQAGWTGGRELVSRADFARWTMEDIEGHWRGGDEEDSYEVGIRALREESERLPQGIVVRYDSAVVTHRDARIAGAQALYREAEGVIYFSGGVVSRDSTRRLQALEMDYHCAAERARLRGGVELVQGDWRLEADTAVLDPSLVQGWGQPARFTWDQGSIAAGELTYDEAGARLRAVDGVVFQRGEQLMQALELVYYQERERLEASGQVVLEEPSLRGRATGGRLHYDLQAGVADLLDDPQLQGRKADWALAAERMRFDIEAGHMTGIGAFAVNSGSLRLRAQRGHYQAAAEELQLAQAVRLLQTANQEGVAGQFKADSVVVHMRAGQVQALHVPGSFQGRWGSVESGEDWIEGGGAELVFGAEGLERLDLQGDAAVTHRYAARGEVSRFQGQRISLWLGPEGLQKASIEGGAELVARLVSEGQEEPAAVNRVAGDKLELEFAAGALTQVRVVESIQGQYYPPEERSP